MTAASDNPSMLEMIYVIRDEIVRREHMLELREMAAKADGRAFMPGRHELAQLRSLKAAADVLDAIEPWQREVRELLADKRRQRRLNGSSPYTAVGGL